MYTRELRSRRPAPPPHLCGARKVSGRSPDQMWYLISVTPVPEVCHDRAVVVMGAEVLSARGIPSKWLISVYRRWGEARLGTILTGNIMIEYDQLEAPGIAIIPPNANFEDERFEAFKELASQCTRNGSLLLGQVSHPGHQVVENVQKHPLSASHVQLRAIPIFSCTKMRRRSPQS
jgi:2,4-dienoyl-CoA reductase-like NADH-dependent reductase (Old Yellow Enzyme family)